MTPTEHLLRGLGRLLAGYLTRPDPRYAPPATSSAGDLQRALQPADVLLVEGNTRVSTAIKYLTQSTWSHAALYIGEQAGLKNDAGQALVLIEADLMNGVCAVPLGKYAEFHTRICRPVGLTEADAASVIRYAVSRIGHSYDLKNLIDLARYLLPTPPVPQRLRRRMIALGSGEPTRALCSTLIAEAFQSVKYPILPYLEHRPQGTPGCDSCVDEVLRARHHTLFAPRDFDISPYFRVVKPRIERGFDYRSLQWSEAPEKIVPLSGR